MKSAYRLLAALGCVALTACSSSADIKDTLGLNRQAPDEFRVLPRPPLSVPPDFNLRPPGQESDYVSGGAARDRAHDQVLGTDASSQTHNLADTAVVPVTSGPLPSGADAQLLANAGAGRADSRVRQRLTDDKMNNVGPKDSGYLFGGKSKDDPQVDPAKEAERLKKDKADNQPPTAGGDTPVVPTKDKGLLGGIF